MHRISAVVTAIFIFFLALSLATLLLRVGALWRQRRLSPLSGAALLTAELVGLAAALIITFSTHPLLLGLLQRFRLPPAVAYLSFHMAAIILAVAGGMLYYRLVHPRVVAWFCGSS